VVAARISCCSSQCFPNAIVLISCVIQWQHRILFGICCKDYFNGLLTRRPRLFHNLRASRETELAQEYPLHVVTGWLGNTPKVALKHYLMTNPGRL
jgi:hypothetical protein